MCHGCCKTARQGVPPRAESADLRLGKCAGTVRSGDLTEAGASEGEAIDGSSRDIVPQTQL